MTHRPIHRMVEDQARDWRMRSDIHAKTVLVEPVVAISRLPGCAGRAVALELARRMGYSLFDKEILEEVAKRSHMSVSRVCFLDEKSRSSIGELVESLIRPGCRGEDYFRHLSRTLLSIAQHGRAVILGRGASFILPPKTCLRVLLVAPLKKRTQDLADRLGISLTDSGGIIRRVETDRRAFILDHFHRDMTDPTNYDIVFNTEGVGVSGVADEIRMAWTMMRGRCMSAGEGSKGRHAGAAASLSCVNDWLAR